MLLIYTWMGGVQPKLGALDNYSSCYDDLADAKRGLTLNAAQIDRVKEYVSGSLIGASKFLHFANPEIYPIWDRRVAEAMYGLPHYYQHQKTENYIQYIDDLSNIDVPDALLKSLRTKLGAASKVRLLEFSLFNLHVSEERQAATVGA